jgi:hypothetical protein
MAVRLEICSYLIFSNVVLTCSSSYRAATCAEFLLCAVCLLSSVRLGLQRTERTSRLSSKSKKKASPKLNESNNYQSETNWVLIVKELSE